MGSILHLHTVPPAGGDTLFASMYAAYEALSPRLQTYLEGLTALHSGERSYRRTNRLLGIDDRGRVHELVERRLAVAAAQKNGYEDLFNGRGLKEGRSAADARRLQQQAVENREKKMRRAEVLLALRELAESIEVNGLAPDAWYGLLSIVLHHAGSDGEALVIARRGIETKKDRNGYVDKGKALLAYAESKLNNGNEMAAFCVAALLASSFWICVCTSPA